MTEIAGRRGARPRAEAAAADRPARDRRAASGHGSRPLVTGNDFPVAGARGPAGGRGGHHGPAREGQAHSQPSSGPAGGARRRRTPGFRSVRQTIRSQRPEGTAPAGSDRALYSGHASRYWARGCCVAAVATTTASAHLERPSYWPDPAPDTSVTPPAGGKVPKARSLASAVTGRGPGDVRVVCQKKLARARARVDSRSARSEGFRLRPSQPVTRYSKKKARQMRRINRALASGSASTARSRPPSTTPATTTAS